MIRIKITIMTILFLILQVSLQAADKYYVLYGIKLGQKMSIASELFGKPFKAEKFDDGFRYEAYKFKDHIIIVEANNTRPDLIWGIQIQGKSNPENLGINGLNLGDNDSRILEIFGNPDEKRDSIDEKTREKISGIQYYSYDKSSNFSIETSDKIVTSIKITFDGYNPSTEVFDIKDFIDILKTKNVYKISNLIASDLLLKKDKDYSIEKSIYHTLSSKNEISEFLFNSKVGLISITDKNIIEKTPIRNKENVIIAFYFKLLFNNKFAHVFFLRSFEGWILKEINLNN